MGGAKSIYDRKDAPPWPTDLTGERSLAADPVPGELETTV